MIRKLTFLLIPLLLLASCKGSNQLPANTDFEEITISTSQNAQTPNLYIQDDNIHAIWTEDHGDTTRLYHSNLTKTQKTATLVAQGTDWFVNWADFSTIIIDEHKPKNMLTHWLQKSDQGTYDYDIAISNSHDAGRTWSPPTILHDDGIAAEHGFVSMSNYDQDKFFLSWLDGRNTKTLDPLDPEKKLPMSIRSALVDKQTLEIREYELDSKVCDCCQTSNVQTPAGMLTAYRDRSDEEIRDIVIQRFSPSGSKTVFKSNDGWKINGCPVNGPALANQDDWNAVAWYTAADSAQVKLAYSNGTAFNNQINIDNGNPLGRVDIEIYNDKAYISWLEMKDQRAEIRLKTIDMTSHTITQDQVITHTSPERRSGFPILKIMKGNAYLAYTEVLSADHTAVRLKKIKL